MTTAANNIIALARNPQQVSNLMGTQNSQLLFPVSERQLAAVGRDGKSLTACPDHKAVMRMVDDKPHVLGVVGADYKVLKNHEFFGVIEQTMLDGLPQDGLKGMKVKESLSYAGAWGRREYIFPALAGQVETPTGFKTRMGFRVIAWNSYDGSSAAGMLCGLIDFYCSNGMILGSFIGKNVRKHTSGLNADLFRTTLRSSLEEVVAERARVQAMADTQLDLDRAEKLLEKHFSARRASSLMERVRTEVATRGQNVFALQSALTYYASHNSVEFGVRNSSNVDNAGKALHNRELEVQQVVHSKDFAELMAA